MLDYFRLSDTFLEGVFNLRADAVHQADDHDGDSGGNQAVLDGGCTGLIANESREKDIVFDLLAERSRSAAGTCRISRDESLKLP